MKSRTEVVGNSDYKFIKLAIWAYFILWVFEGALRKWVVPSLATPMLIVRDPIAVYILLRAIYLNVRFSNAYIVIAVIFTLLSLGITLTFGHENLFVGIYGARIMLIHFPIIFVIGSTLNKEDVLKMGRVLLVLNIIVTIIIYFQFNSPQTAPINVGVGGEGSSGFSGALGYSRPSGPFSFTTGLSVFYSAVAVFIFYFWLSKDYCSKILLYVSTTAMVIALPLTISRGAVVGVLIVGLFAIAASVTSGKMIIKLILAGIGFVSVILILQNFTTIFSLGTEVFMDRVESANKFSGGGIEDSILLRMWEGFIDPIVAILDNPMFAGKLGMGTNAGARMMTGKDQISFLIAEGEFGRIAGEQGIVFGGGTILLRLILASDIAIKSWKLPREDKLLPFVLCGAAIAAIIQGQWAQPTILGYAVIIVGLVLASMNIEKFSALEDTNLDKINL